MERFTRRELTIIALFIAFAVAAGAFVWTNFSRAFPEAHLQFKVNRQSSQATAESFLAKHAPQAAKNVIGAKHAAIFQVENSAKVYLERELGLEKLGELTTSRQVRLWSWSHRFFRPLHKEEVLVEVAPEGEIIGFSHQIAEEQAGPSLEEPQARAIAESLLKTAFGLDEGALTFIESKREDRPKRRDWTFTFERAGWKAKESTYRMQVEVHGDEAAAYREYLKIPDAWSQSYQRLRAANDTTAMVAIFGIVLTLIAGIIVLLREARRRNVRWRLVVGMTLVSFGLTFLLSLNNLSLATYNLDTKESFGTFILTQLLQAMGSAGLQSLLIFIMVAAGEPLYRARFGDHLRISAIAEKVGWRSKRFAFGLIVGYCLAFLFVAYQVMFYLVGSKFGAWNPADVPFDNMLNTSFPWLAVLFMGFYPAVSEEFMSRVFSIPLVEKITKSRITAIVVPALIWGFAHANYPAQPFYIRGVEVSIAGLFVGIILYRFGVIPCLVWHYVVDAGYTSMLLVRSGNLYFVITAVAGTCVLLVPLFITLVAAWKRGGFAVDDQALNASDPAPEEETKHVSIPEVPFTAPPLRRLLPIAIILGVAGLVASLLAPNFGKNLTVSKRPDAVREAARKYLITHDNDGNSWQLVVTTRGDVLGSLNRRYLLENGGLDVLERAAQRVPAWQVRAFRPEDREQWQLGVDDTTLQVVRFEHSLREEAPGASLSSDQARALAEQSLRSSGFDPAKLVFKNATSENKKARTDHNFSWKDPVNSAGEAEYLIEVGVAGDAVVSQQRSFKLPEPWERQRDRGSVLGYTLLTVRFGLLALIIVYGLYRLYEGMRGRRINWRITLLVASAFALLAIIKMGMDYPLAWQNYDTAWPAGVYRVSVLIILSIGVVVQASLVVLGVAIILATLPSAASVISPAARRPVAWAALAAAIATIGAFQLFAGIQGLMLRAMPTAFSDVPIGFSPSLATFLPVLDYLPKTVFLVIMSLALIATTAHFLAGDRRRSIGIPLAIAVVFALIPVAATQTSLELFFAFIKAILLVGSCALLARYILGANPIAYIVTLVWIGAFQIASHLIGQHNLSCRVQGWIFLALTIVVSIWWLFRREESQFESHTQL